MSAVAYFDCGDAGAFGEAAKHQIPVKRPLARPVQVAEVASSVSHGQHHAGGQGMSSVQDYSTSEKRFAEIVGAAIQRRVGTGEGKIPTKVFAFYMQVSEQAVWSWLGAYKAPSADKLIKMLSFFDACFANELLGRAGLVSVKAKDLQRASYFQKVNQAAPALRRINELCALVDEPEAAE